MSGKVSSVSHFEMVCRLTPNFFATFSCDNPLFFLALNKLLPKLIMSSSSGIVLTISIMRMKEKIYQSYLAYMRVFFTFKVIT